MTSNSERWRELATEPEENKTESRKREIGLKLEGTEMRKDRMILKGYTIGNKGEKVIKR